ncbi:MAG: hypothetical protein ACYCOU_03855 [Sulfobacillus sp.]
MCQTCLHGKIPTNKYVMLCQEVVQVHSIPEGVQILYCHGCPTDSLPRLPDTLTELWCEEMPRLARIPALPAKLEKLTVRNCPSFRQVPPLPQGLCSLTWHLVA